MQINELISGSLRSQFLINLNSYTLKSTTSSSNHQIHFRGAVTNVWTAY